MMATKKRDGTYLPYDVLASIAYLVTSEDYIRFSVVCKQWHSVAKAEKQNHMATRKQIPFLLIPTKNHQWRLYNVAQDRLLDSNLGVQVPSRHTICGSSHGWLIFAGYDHDDIVITLLNPFTQARISLPPIPPTTYGQQKPWSVQQVVLSADPWNDFIVAACIHEGWSYVLALIRPGTSRKWRTLTHSSYCMTDMMFDRSGKWIYASIHKGLIVRAEADLEEEDGVLETVVQLQYETSLDYLGEASSGGDLLLFFRLWDEQATVCKLQGSSCAQVHDLVGDTVAFAGKHSSTTLVGQGFLGVETDCVHFYCMDSADLLRKVNLKDREFNFHPLWDDLPSGCYYSSVVHPVWILPSINL